MVWIIIYSSVSVKSSALIVNGSEIKNCVSFFLGKDLSSDKSKFASSIIKFASSLINSRLTNLLGFSNAFSLLLCFSVWTCLDQLYIAISFWQQLQCFFCLYLSFKLLLI